MINAAFSDLGPFYVEQLSPLDAGRFQCVSKETNQIVKKTLTHLNQSLGATHSLRELHHIAMVHPNIQTIQDIKDFCIKSLSDRLKEFSQAVQCTPDHLSLQKVQLWIMLHLNDEKIENQFKKNLLKEILFKNCYELLTEEIYNSFKNNGIHIKTCRTPETRYTPLHLTVWRGYFESTKILLERGLDPNRQDSRLQTPLLLSVQLANKEIAELLLSQGADPNIANRDDISPLYLAANLEHGAPLIDLLLHFGADIDKACEPAGETALHNAVVNRKVENVQLLLKQGANPNCQNAFGATPLSLAATEEIADLLIEYGANPQTTNALNELPLFDF